MELTKLTTCRQTGEGHIVAVGPAEAGCGAGSVHTELAHTDALMTNCAGLPLAVFTADSAPVILFDPAHHACAVGRAGLRKRRRGCLRKWSWPWSWYTVLFPPTCTPTSAPCRRGPCRNQRRLRPGRSTHGACLCLLHRPRSPADDRFEADRAAAADRCGTFVGPYRYFSFVRIRGGGTIFSYRRDFGRTGRMAAFAVL